MWPDFKQTLVRQASLKDQLFTRLQEVAKSLSENSDSLVTLTHIVTPLRDGGGVDCSYRLMGVARVGHREPPVVPLFRVRCPAKNGKIVITPSPPFGGGFGIPDCGFDVESVDDIDKFVQRLTGHTDIHRVVVRMMQEATT